jgi:hypothetical protein
MRCLFARVIVRCYVQQPSPPLAISFNVLVSRPKDFIYIGWIFVLLSIVCLAYAAWRTTYAW